MSALKYILERCWAGVPQKGVLQLTDGKIWLHQKKVRKARGFSFIKLMEAFACTLVLSREMMGFNR